jgi:hypothetical protein
VQLADMYDLGTQTNVKRRSAKNLEEVHMLTLGSVRAAHRG